MNTRDPQGKPLAFTWDDVATEKGQSENLGDLSHDPSPTLRLHVHETNCGQSTHKITLTASNGTEAATSSVQVTIVSAVCTR